MTQHNYQTPTDPGLIENALPGTFTKTVAAGIDQADRYVDQLAQWAEDKYKSVVAKWKADQKEQNKRIRRDTPEQKKLSESPNLTVKSVASDGNRFLRIQAYKRDPRTYKRIGNGAMYEIPMRKKKNGDGIARYDMRVINYELRPTPELKPLFQEMAQISYVVMRMSRRNNAQRKLANENDQDRARTLNLPIPYLTDRQKKPAAEEPATTTKPSIKRTTRWEDYADPSKHFVSRRRRDL